MHIYLLLYFHIYSGFLEKMIFFLEKNTKENFLLFIFTIFKILKNSKFRDSSLIARIILSRLAKTDRLYLQTCMCYGVSRKPLFLA